MLSSLDVLMYEEFVSVLFVLVFLKFAVSSLAPALFRRDSFKLSAWYLIACYLGVVSLAFFRGLGLYLSNPVIRFYGALLSGLVTMVFYALWGSTQLNWSSRVQHSMLVLSWVGGLLFAVGAAFNVYIAVLGLFLLFVVVVFTVLALLRFVLSRIPNVLAQQRVKVITIGISVFILFELLGVYFMDLQLWGYAAISFLLRTFMLGFATLGVVFPDRLKEVLVPQYKHSLA